MKDKYERFTDVSTSFVARPWTIAITLLRLALIVLASPQRSIVASLFVRPDQSLEYVEEINAMRYLAGDGALPEMRMPPLVLGLFTALRSIEPRGFDGVLCKLLLLLVDLLIAMLLENIANHLLFRTDALIEMEEDLQLEMAERIRPTNESMFAIYRREHVSKGGSEKSDTLPIISMNMIPPLASACYYASPVTILASSVYGCSQNLPLALILLGIHESCRPQGSRIFSSFYIAAAAYVEYHSVVFLVPCMLSFARELNSDKYPTNPGDRKATISVHRDHFSSSAQPRIDWWPLLNFMLCTACLQMSSFLFSGSEAYLKFTVTLFSIPWSSLQPSLSVMWYLHMQSFDRFRDFFGVLISGLPYLLVLPLTMRLHRYPAVIVAILWFVWTIFRPAQTLFDANVGFCILLWSPRSLARMSIISAIAIASMPVPVCLYVVDMWMWLEAGNGNANFIFFQCLAHNIFLGIILNQFCSASVQRDKALRLTAKETK